MMTDSIFDFEKFKELRPESDFAPQRPAMPEFDIRDTVPGYTMPGGALFSDEDAAGMQLPVALGHTADGQLTTIDLAAMPHLLIGGATGQGKSVCVHSIISSLLRAKHPAELKLVLIDPKMVELWPYERVSGHFLASLPEEEAVVTDYDKALDTLSALCMEMDARFELLRAARARNISDYNRSFCQRRLNPEQGHHYLPYIVVIIDEFADLMMVMGAEITAHIARIAQKARMAGIHLVITTQRPSADIITGSIKANFPGRIAFRVAQMADSRIILDAPGANRLPGGGAMLFSHNGDIVQLQGIFTDTPDIDALVDHIVAQPGGDSPYLLPEPVDAEPVPSKIQLGQLDDLFANSARLFAHSGKASTSQLQRQYCIGYSRAGKIMDQLESAGIIGPAKGGAPRDVLIPAEKIEIFLESL